MKGSFLIPMMLCMTCPFTYGQIEYPASLKEMNVNGKVKTITEKCYESKLKNADYKKGKLYSTTVYTFNETGNLMEETKDAVDRWSKEETKTKIIYKYDDNGHLIERNTVKNGNLVNKLLYTYNEKGIKSGYTEFFSDGSIQGKQDFKIDDNGHKTASLWYGRGGTLLENKLYYKYDNKGNQTECSTADKNGKIYGTDYFTYNESGKLVELKKFMEQKQIQHSTYKYDNTGNISEFAEYYANGNVSSKGVYRNAYDQNSNLVQYMFFVDGLPGDIYERVITYVK
jgi:hypothetical protein